MSKMGNQSIAGLAELFSAALLSVSADPRKAHVYHEQISGPNMENFLVDGAHFEDYDNVAVRGVASGSAQAN